MITEMAVRGLTVAALTQTRADPIIVTDALIRIRIRGQQHRVTDHKRARDKHKVTLSQIRIQTGATRNGARTTIQTQEAKIPGVSRRFVSRKPLRVKGRLPMFHHHKTQVTTGALHDLSK